MKKLIYCFIGLIFFHSSIGFANNYVCSHNFNGRDTINKYEKINNSSYVQFGDDGKKFFHAVVFENNTELHLHRIVLERIGECASGSSIITIVDKVNLRATTNAICVSSKSPSAYIYARCIEF